MQQDFNNNISLYTNCIIFKWQKRKEYYHLHAMILPARKSLIVESIEIEDNCVNIGVLYTNYVHLQRYCTVATNFCLTSIGYQGLDSKNKYA